jgi:hypothetical protein
MEVDLLGDATKKSTEQVCIGYFVKCIMMYPIARPLPTLRDKTVMQSQGVLRRPSTLWTRRAVQFHSQYTQALEKNLLSPPIADHPKVVKIPTPSTIVWSLE